VFVNAVVYMKPFDGQPPLTKKRSSAGDWLVDPRGKGRTESAAGTEEAASSAGR